MSDKKIKVAVIGGGAAGMMTAHFLSTFNIDTVIFEKNYRLGRKLGITGKGRCNLTNNCSVTDFIANVPTNPKFLYSAISSFTPQDTMELFEGFGVPLKTERGNRVFPVSDKAADIVNALSDATKCKVIHERVVDVNASDERTYEVVTQTNKYQFDNVVIATGGRSYQMTGSTGDGYYIAKRLGINVVEQAPSLVPLIIKEKWCASLQGLSLRNVSIRIEDTASGKEVYNDFGEMMFTHYGVTGPIILSASSVLKKMSPERYKIFIDLKPALDEKTLDNRLLSDFSAVKNKHFSNSLDKLLPQKLIPVIVKLSGIGESKQVNSITQAERADLVRLLKSVEMTVMGFRPINEA
ncbi:MAG: aminoacetone oxidase family FAD-binding enzyme, partial [Ruminococcaceae bacterium]|nr:aminoacetone oxidase family FAD-binding enzyme [Oscillospiraceae bacterium]